MTRLERIEREIEALGPQELARFRAWFTEHDAANWDAEFEDNAATGKLDGLADKALEAHRSGRTRAL